MHNTNAMKNQKKKKKMFVEDIILNVNTYKVSIRYYIYCRRPQITTSKQQTNKQTNDNLQQQQQSAQAILVNNSHRQEVVVTAEQQQQQQKMRKFRQKVRSKKLRG